LERDDVHPALTVTAAPWVGKLRYLFVSLGLIALDQWTKWLVEIHLPQHTAQPIIPGLLNLTHVRNTGVAFGLFASQGMSGGSWLLTLLGLAALAAVAIYFWFASAHDRLLLVSLALVVGGAIGNLIDRIREGFVTDFIDPPRWPAFNVADIEITLGVLILIGVYAFGSDPAPEGTSEQRS
jgi:signal peptidase II